MYGRGGQIKRTMTAQNTMKNQTARTKETCLFLKNL